MLNYSCQFGHGINTPQFHSTAGTMLRSKHGTISPQSCSDYMICCADFDVYDFVMHDFSVYTDITNCVIPPVPPPPPSPIHERSKYCCFTMYPKCLLVLFSESGIRLDRPPRLWARSWIRRCPILRSVFIDKRIVFKEDPQLSPEDPKGNRQPCFSLFFC